MVDWQHRDDPGRTSPGSRCDLRITQSFDRSSHTQQGTAEARHIVKDAISNADTALPPPPPPPLSNIEP